MATSGFDQDVQAAHALPPAPLDTIRRRARQRLIGAALLVAAAVIAFPLLFDAEPRPIAVDIPIEIPAREAAAPLAVPDAPSAQGAPDAAPPGSSASAQSTPSLPLNPPPGSPDEKTAAAALPTAPGNTGAPQQAAAAPGSSAINTAAAAQPARPAPAAQPARPNASTPTAPAAKTPPRPVAPPSSGVDVARALLENGNGTQVASLSPKPPARERFVVQVGAFTDVSRARAVRAQLEMAGLKTFVQEVKGSDGKITTRVRLGTFNNLGEANRTAARVKALGLLDAKVIKL